MKKIIIIKNEPTFNRGVVTYLTGFNSEADNSYSYEFAPYIKKAKNVEFLSLDESKKLINYIKKSYKQATVEIVEI